MALVSKAFGDIITFERATTGTFFNSAGVLQSAAINAPRLDYNPSTLAAQGLLIEEQRVNSIRNNTMVGAVAGTPGTLPTNWQVVGGGLGTLTQQIVGTSTSSGITYIDVRLSGTTSTTSVGYTFDSLVQSAASVGQTWTNSFYVARVAGSNTNVSAIETRIIDRDAAGANLGSSANNFLSSLATSFTRPTVTRTLAGVGTAFVSSDIFISFASGVAIDITLRIGLPQLEQGAFATSVIPTTTAAVTRSADVASVNTLSPWFNATAGTLYAEFNIPAALAAGTNPRSFTLQGAGGASVDELSLFISQTSGKAASFNAFTGGVNAGRIDASPSFVANTTVKATASYAANDRAVTTGGATPTTSTTAYTIPTITNARLGSQDIAGVNAINGYLRRITYYPRKLTDAELQAITA